VRLGYTITDLSGLISMIKKPSATILLILLFATCFLLFVPPNFSGAKDPNMLAAFRDELLEFGTDEWTQFGVLMNMTRVKPTAYETLYNVLFYGYFPYGYSFFSTSLIAILPVKLANAVFGTNLPTYTYMIILRQLSPLWTLAAITLLVYLWTGFKSAGKSVLLFLFLLGIPAVFQNNMFWHPDGLAILFVVLTIFSLVKDDLNFGTWFYVAAASCGLAAGVKIVGLFFFFSVATYLLLGLAKSRLTLGVAVKRGVLFVLVMAGAIVISNPLLLIPSMAREFVIALNRQAAWNENWGMPRPHGPLAWYSETLRWGFGFWWIYALALLASLLGIRYNRKNRLLNIIVLTWAAPLSVYIFYAVGAASFFSHYFIPTLLPLMSCIGNLFDLPVQAPSGQWRRPAVIAAGVCILLCTVQFGYYVVADVHTYAAVLERESNSSSLRFYRQLQESYLSRLPQNSQLTILREPKLYVPPSPNWQDHPLREMDYDDLEHFHPDVLIMSKGVIDAVSEKGYQFSNPQKQSKILEFYADVKVDKVAGFHKQLETDLAIAFARDGN
jgi:hypothetical protein